jgi:hypothetical protein
MNLFYLLNFFRAKELNNFWLATKSPVKLITLIRKPGLALSLLGRDLTLPADENFIDPWTVQPLPTLSHNGFLTVTKTSKRSGGARLGLSFPNRSARWLLFIYLMAKAFNCKAGHLWMEIDQLLRALKNRNASVTALAFKRLLSSVRHRSEPPFGEHYRQIFLHTTSVLGRTVQVGDQADRGRVTGLVKFGDDSVLIVQMSHHRLAADFSSEDPDKYDGEDDGFDIDDEWRYPSKRILAYEEELTGPAKASLASLSASEMVGAIRRQGLEVTRAALVVHSSSVVKVLMETD